MIFRVFGQIPMFQTLDIPSPTQSLSFAASLNPTSLKFLRRASSVRVRATTVEDFSRCLVESWNPTPVSLYEVLRVKQNASPADIKKAYRRLGRIKNHQNMDITSIYVCIFCSLR